MVSIDPGLLESRYGIKPNSKARNRTLIIAFAAVLVAAFAIWQFGIGGYNASAATAEVVGYQVPSERQITLNINLTKPGSATATCALQALNVNFGVVGYKEVTFGPDTAKGQPSDMLTTDSSQTTHQYALTFNTTELAVSGVVDSCWLN